VTTLQTQALASITAQQNLAANLAALRRTQPQLAMQFEHVATDVEWVFARDRTLTALYSSSEWWSGCSIPMRAAEAILARLDVKGSVGCFLAPRHWAFIRTALSKLRPEQAVIAIIPEIQDLALMAAWR
jgi:hypothetical protein